MESIDVITFQGKHRVGWARVDMHKRHHTERAYAQLPHLRIRWDLLGDLINLNDVRKMLTESANLASNCLPNVGKTVLN